MTAAARSWTRVALALALCAGAAATVRDVGPAHAQPAAAIGQPLVDANLEARTVVVKVIAGDRAKAATGVDVTLAIVPPDGGATVERVARTDAEGRATFVDLPSGAVVTARVTGPGGEQRSAGFPVPVTGGNRVLLSTLPVAGEAQPGAAGAGGPMTGQPQPRAMSGRPRPQQGDAADTLTVRLSHDDLVDPRPPHEQPVVLVAYRYDQTVTAKVVNSDAAGRAAFTGLDRTGATSYFALTTLPRGAVHDRLTSGPIQMIADDGLRLMLSGEQRDADKPAVDDLATLSPQPPEPVAAGVVEVVVAGVPEDGAAVELVDAVSGQVVASRPAGPPLPAQGTAQATWKPAVPEPSLAVGTVEVSVLLDGQPAPTLAIEIRRRAPVATPEGGQVVPGAPGAPVGPAPLTGVTSGGKATITGVTPGEKVDVVVVTPAGRSAAQELTIPDRGGMRLTAEVTWKERGQAGAILAGTVTAPERAFYVRSRMHGQLHLSAPFQLTPARGAQINIVAMPRVMLGFSLTSWVDDQYLAVTGQWTISNSSWAPYLATKDDRPVELIIPMPKRATGVQVRDDFAAMVGTDPDRGLVLRRPIPPGGLEFFAGFSMKIDDGAVRWDLPLPYGSFESGIELLRPNSTTRIITPEGTKVSIEEASDRRGRFWVMSPITILPPQRMVFTVEGLPRPPAWNEWTKIIVGVLVLGLLISALAIALHRGAAAAARDATRARYDRLLDELAALDRAGPDPDADDALHAVRRARLLGELEALRERLDQTEAGARAKV